MILIKKTGAGISNIRQKNIKCMGGNIMNNQQTASLEEYARINAVAMIKKIIELLEYQENVSITYVLKEK